MSSVLFDVFNFFGAAAQDFEAVYTNIVKPFVGLADGASQLIGMFV